LAQSPLTTLEHETNWAYSTAYLSDIMVRVSTCWPISSALSAQGCLRHAANTQDVWFQIVFVCRPVRMEPTNYLQTFARSPLFRLLNNTSRHIFSTLLLLLIFS